MGPDDQPAEGFPYAEDLSALSADELDSTEADATEAFEALADQGDDLTEEQVAEMERLSDYVVQCRNARQALSTQAEERRARAEAAAQRIADPLDSEQQPDPEPGNEDGDDNDEEEEPGSAEDDPSSVAASGRRTPRPRRALAAARRPANPRPRSSTTDVVITAGADISGVPSGSRLDDLLSVARAFMARSKGFTAPPPGRQSGVFNRYGVATFARPTDADGLRDDNPDFKDLQSIIDVAKRESRLPGGSLTAAGGWCAPSETLYGLCQTESLDGIIDMPEMTVSRGGVRFTPGPDFSEIYANAGFALTEAQVIAGTQKTCVEVDCPDFEEVRLDVVGLCVKSPILTRAGYPELVQRWIEGTTVANAHKVAGRIISTMATLLGSATAGFDAGSVTSSTLTGLELAGEGIRYKYRMGRNDTLEVIAPFWLRTAIRGDLANRTGQPFDDVSDQQINAHFAARGLAVQWVYNYQDTDFVAAGCVVAFPDTAEVLMYPAGTFVVGRQDVISLDTIYDTTDLMSNMFTAAFVEDGILVAQTCYQGCRVTIPVCVSGRTGAADLTDCFGTVGTP